jgi:hypothetical protein
MAAKVYTLQIQKMQEGKTTYYLGKVPWLRGFLVEWNTVEKVKELAPYILKDYLETVEEMKKANQYRKMLQFSLQSA